MNIKKIEACEVTVRREIINEKKREIRKEEEEKKKNRKVKFFFARRIVGAMHIRLKISHRSQKHLKRKMKDFHCSEYFSSCGLKISNARPLFSIETRE